jgi:hypothetical protein
MTIFPASASARPRTTSSEDFRGSARHQDPPGAGGRDLCVGAAGPAGARQQGLDAIGGGVARTVDDLVTEAGQAGAERAAHHAGADDRNGLRRRRAGHEDGSDE